ncbi:hypothetical protein OB905_02420 [Halobacteria archaeon AArc-dxtr1]|nr:hypothetical protein [Halobacteria archaeon AArc-dxtr1]
MGDDDTLQRTCSPSEAVTIDRRTALTAAGSLSLASLAGCAGSIPFVGGDRVEITEKEEPGDDPDGSPEEFYYMLEDNDIVVDELYHDTGDDDYILFYESQAEDREESDDEIALIYLIFRDGLVDRGSPVNHVYTEVLDRYDGQVEGWGINSQWAEEDLAGEASELDVWNEIVDSKIYPEDSDEALDDNLTIDEESGDVADDES